MVITRSSSSLSPPSQTKLNTIDKLSHQTNNLNHKPPKLSTLTRKTTHPTHQPLSSSTSVPWSTSPSSLESSSSSSSSSSPPRKLRRTTRHSPSKQNSISKSISQPIHLTSSLEPIVIVPISSSRQKLRSIENISSNRSSHQLSELPDLPSYLKSTPKPKLPPTVKPLPVPLPFSNIFSHARHLLRLTSVSDLEKDRVVGRTQELGKLNRFLSTRYPDLFQDLDTGSDSKDHQQNFAHKSLYISGPPGTGKSHLIHSVLVNPNHSIHRSLRRSGIRVHSINCLAIGGAQVGGSSGLISSGSLDEEIWYKIASCIECKEISKTPQKGKKRLSFKEQVERSVLDDRCQPSIIILDEIDHLATSKHPLITSLFTLSHQAPNSNFTVIGIANTLDLTTRFKWSSDSGAIEPTLIHFSPFDSNEMIEIVKQRLKHLLPSYNPHRTQTHTDSPAQKLFSTPDRDEQIPLFNPTALTLCAKRVSNVTGDLRTFLSILRKLIDRIEHHTIQNLHFLNSSSSDDPLKPSSSSVLDTPTKLRKFTRVISTSQLLPDLSNPKPLLEPKTEIDDPLNHLTPLTVPKITASDVLRFFKTSTALSNETNPNQNSEVECTKKIRDLNLNQSIVLVCLCVGWSRDEKDEILKSRAYDVYKTSIDSKGLGKVSESEWQDLVESGLQTGGLVKCKNQEGTNVPSSSHSTTSSSSSISRSPSKKNLGFGNRTSGILSTPTKPSPLRTSSVNKQVNTTPRQTRGKGSDGYTIVSVYPISTLVQCIKSMDQGDDHEKEMMRILRELIVDEERSMRRSNVILKRKLEDHQKDLIGDLNRREEVEDDLLEEEVVRERIVGKEDEGSVKD